MSISAPTDLSTTPAAKLIDDLTYIDSEAPGLHGTAAVRGFIAEDKPLKFGGGVLGSPAPVVPPAMRELARRGPQVLSDLIQHLDDKRPTKLTVGKGGFFMFRYFSDEYDPKGRPDKPPRPDPNPFERGFDGGYTVKVGDVCFAIIGQIVDRNLVPIRYQPTAGLVVNSPIESPSLIDRVKKDWGHLDVLGHKVSLINDARSSDNPWTLSSALIRLRFYYPDDYERFKRGDLKKGDLQGRIAAFEAFEADENKQH